MPLDNSKLQMTGIEPSEELNITVAVRCRGRSQREINLRSPIVVSIPNEHQKKPSITISTSPPIKSNSKSRLKTGPNEKERGSSSSSSSNHNINSDRDKYNDKNNGNTIFGLDLDLNLQTTSKTYTFDHVFDTTTPQSTIFATIAEPLLNEFLRGYNCTVLVYGMTASGKTYTMTGDERLYDGCELSAEAGIIPRVLVRLFERLGKVSSDGDYVVKCSFLELYNESLKDLLDDSGDKVLRVYDSSASSSSSSSISTINSERGSGRLRGRLDRRRRVVSDTPSSLRSVVRDKRRLIDSVSQEEEEEEEGITRLTNCTHKQPGGSGIYVQNLKEFHITTARDGIQLLQRGLRLRQTAMTRMNDISSRSHTIFTICLYKEHSNGELFRVSKMNLVDLAGSENIHKSGAMNQRARETGSINQSLLTLGRVINSLADHRAHIPFRESKLTRLLQDSLGGNTKTALIATISPAKINVEETLSTLEYATKAKGIKNKPKLGTIVTKDILLKSITLELARIRSDLFSTRDKDGIYMNHEHYRQLTGEIESYKSKIEGLQQTVETLTRGNQSLVEESHRLSQTMESQTSKISSLNAYIERLETELNLKKKQEELLTGQLTEFSETILTLNDEIQVLHSREGKHSDKFRAMLDGELKHLEVDLTKNLERLEALTQSSTFDIKSEMAVVKKELNKTLQSTNSQIHDVYSKCLQNLFTETPNLLTTINDKLLKVRESSVKFQADIAEKLSDISEENNIFKQFLHEDFLKLETHDDLLNSHINKTTSIIQQTASEMMNEFKRIFNAYVTSSKKLIEDSLKNSTSDIFLQETKNLRMRLSRWEASTELINKCDLLNNIHNNNITSKLMDASNSLEASGETLLETSSKFNAIRDAAPVVDTNAVVTSPGKIDSKGVEIGRFVTDSLDVAKRSIDKIKTLDDSIGTILKEIEPPNDQEKASTFLGKFPLINSKGAGNASLVPTGVGHEIGKSPTGTANSLMGSSEDAGHEGLKRHLEIVVNTASDTENIPPRQQLKIPRLK